VPTPQNSLAWDIANLGNEEVWVAPYAVLRNSTAALPGHLTGEAILSQGTNIIHRMMLYGTRTVMAGFSLEQANGQASDLHQRFRPTP